MGRHIAFSVVDLGHGNYAVDEHGRTVAIVTRQGFVDWLLRTPLCDGELVRELYKETHMCYTLGLKLELMTQAPRTLLTQVRFNLQDDARKLTIVAQGDSADQRFHSRTNACLLFDEEQGEYRWDLVTTLSCTADEPVDLPRIEYNNVYPGKAGRCFMYASQKEYHSTLIEAADGAIWEFPHQHLFHYSRKLDKLDFSSRGMAGFFGEQSGSPVVIVRRSSLPISWAICDMYYDLHCLARVSGPFTAGMSYQCEYTIRYLSPVESRQYQKRARRVSLTAGELREHDYPRLELGMNAFDAPVAVDRFDDASGFRPKPPARVWEKPADGKRGALRLSNPEVGENVWSAEPPTQLPPSSRLTLSALARTQDVSGKGFFVRVRYHTFEWYPEPHVEWADVLESMPLTGTHGEWTRIELPLLEVPPEDRDYLIWIDVVLDGAGTGWLTDVDIDLVRVRQAQQAIV